MSITHILAVIALLTGCVALACSWRNYLRSYRGPENVFIMLLAGFNICAAIVLVIYA